MEKDSRIPYCLFVDVKSYKKNVCSEPNMCLPRRDDYYCERTYSLQNDCLIRYYLPSESKFTWLKL